MKPLVRIIVTLVVTISCLVFVKQALAASTLYLVDTKFIPYAQKFNFNNSNIR
ncbi:MAG: hypothetical protein ACTMUB_03110 [cyanobacterium endosymbiont of Rhopalodia musculus]